ncbi:hypothetical protein Gpo141_00013859 [Globisporangium polare]
MDAKLAPQAPRRPAARRLAVAVGAFVTLVTVLVFQLSASSTQAAQAFPQDAQHHHRALRNMDTTALPTLRLHFTMKRSSLNVHGLSEFDVLANPVVSDKSSVSYNSVATFQVGDVTHKYMVVDGVTYHVTESSAGAAATTTCLAADSFPQVGEMLAALNGASRINGVQSSQSIDCPSDKLYKLAFGGDTFVLCSTLRANGPGFKVFGADLNVEARYMPSAVSIAAPALTVDQAEACGKLTSSASVSSRTMNLLSGASASSSSTDSYVNVAADSTASNAVLADATCACKGAKRPCIFFHGLGQATEGAVADSSTYFGDIKGHAPCCTTIKFANLNTVNFGWNNDTLQQKVCDIALSQSATSNTATKVIADTIVVAHSMGNNMLAGAISTGKCSLAKSSEWVALSGPMKGSMGSDYLQKSCGSGGLSGLIAGIVGKCPADTATKALAYEGEAYCPATLKAQYDAAQVSFKQSVTAAMCSDGNTGLSSSDQLTYRLGGSIIGHKSSENDGIVEYQSCRADIPTTQFANTYTSKFYVTKLNHADTAFRHGDSASNNAQKPVKWFECLL